MSESYSDGYDRNPAMGRVCAIPKETGDAARSPQTISRWQYLKRAVLPRFSEGESMGKEYLKGKASQESAKAKKELAEACLLASQKEKVDAETDSIKLENMAKFAGILEKMEHMSPETRQVMFAKMLAQDPRLQEQMDKLEYKAKKLNYEKNFMIQAMPQAQLEGSPSETSSEEVL